VSVRSEPNRHARLPSRGTGKSCGSRARIGSHRTQKWPAPVRGVRAISALTDWITGPPVGGVRSDETATAGAYTAPAQQTRMPIAVDTAARRRTKTRRVVSPTPATDSSAANIAPRRADTADPRRTHVLHICLSAAPVFCGDRAVAAGRLRCPATQNPPSRKGVSASCTWSRP
jgi:hypothetical protein